jgi:hypothetical protein
MLLVSTLLGGTMLYSLGFAPLVFSAMPSEDAGRLSEPHSPGTISL